MDDHGRMHTHTHINTESYAHTHTHVHNHPHSTRLEKRAAVAHRCDVVLASGVALDKALTLYRVSPSGCTSPAGLVLLSLLRQQYVYLCIHIISYHHIPLQSKPRSKFTPSGHLSPPDPILHSSSWMWRKQTHIQSKN